MQVRNRIDRFGRALARRCDRLIAQHPAFGEAFRREQPDRHPPDAGGRDARLAASCPVAFQEHGDRDDRRSTAPLRHLLEGKAGAGAHGRHPQRDDHLVGSKRGRVGTTEEVLCADDANTAPALRDDLAAQHFDDHRQFGHGISVGERSADRATRADRQISDPADGVTQQRQPRHDARVLFRRALADHAADADRALLLRNPVEARDTADVDHGGRRYGAKVHQRDEALAARQDARGAATLAQNGKSFVEPARREVGERCGLHRQRVRSDMRGHGDLREKRHDRRIEPVRIVFDHHVSSRRNLDTTSVGHRRSNPLGHFAGHEV